MTNQIEFFAELSVAYFGENHSFPFTRDDLREFDPVSYQTIANAWERPADATPRRLSEFGGWQSGAPK
ncbi:MAG: hypothetical protein JSR91_01785 [Proteobacteria bacterium]|nr:hypothetical protein [Pseudomonadota bacterium]